MAGVMGQPQSFERGGPSAGGPRRTSPSMSFKLGKSGLVARGFQLTSPLNSR